MGRLMSWEKYTLCPIILRLSETSIRARDKDLVLSLRSWTPQSKGAQWYSCHPKQKAWGPSGPIGVCQVERLKKLAIHHRPWQQQQCMHLLATGETCVVHQLASSSTLVFSSGLQPKGPCSPQSRQALVLLVPLIHIGLPCKCPHKHTWKVSC